MKDPNSDDEKESYDYWTFNDVIQTIDEYHKFINIRLDPGKFLKDSLLVKHHCSSTNTIVGIN